MQRANGNTETVPSKDVFTLSPGDRLSIETAGGGGFGDPAKRDAAETEADYLNGKALSR